MHDKAEIEEAARRLIAEYGDKAAARAAIQADTYFKQGNLIAYTTWTAILKAVEALQESNS